MFWIGFAAGAGTVFMGLLILLVILWAKDMQDILANLPENK